MTISEILKAIKSGDMEINIKLGCVDDETVFRYRRIKEVLEDTKLLYGFKKDYYTILSMYFLQDMTHTEIAEELGIAERTVYRKINTGIEELEKKYSKR